MGVKPGSILDSDDRVRQRKATSHLKDVFVIGAGASVPYGMPTGAELLARMRKIPLAVPSDEPVLKEVMARTKPQIGLSEKLAADFHTEWVKQIKGSVILSIDQFLRNRTHDKIRRYGLALMARELVGAEMASLRESRDALRQDSNSQPDKHIHATDWIQALLSQVDLLENAEEYLLSTVFLSFNYDRILEFFLRQFLVVERNKTLGEADDFIGRMRIFHMNGYLGPLSTLPFGNAGRIDSLPWVLLENGTPRSLGEPSYLEIAARLRTVWDAGEHENSNPACDAVQNAERLFMLGTSFIPENMEAIGLGSWLGWGTDLAVFEGFHATTLGLSKAQIARVARMLGVEDAQGADPDRWSCFHPVTCKDLVIDEVVL